MIGARGLRRFAALPLLARAAAARLVTSRADHRRREGEPWRPASLRWRRPRRQRPDRIVVRAVTTTNNHWWRPPAVLATFPANAPVRSSGSAAAGSQLVTRTELRFLVERRTLVLRGGGGPARATAAGQRARLSPLRTSPAAELHLPTREPARAAASYVPAPEPAPRLLHRLGGTPFAPPDGARRVGAEIAGAASPTLRRFTARRELTLLRPRAPEAARLTRPLAPEDGALPVRLARPADITWRHAPRSASGPGGAEVRSSFPAAAFRPSSPSPAAPDELTSAQASTGRTTPTRTAQFLDPVVLDRLADDVIRRVERRVRIDRERRGL